MLWTRSGVDVDSLDCSSDNVLRSFDVCVKHGHDCIHRNIVMAGMPAVVIRCHSKDGVADLLGVIVELIEE